MASPERRLFCCRLFVWSCHASFWIEEGAHKGCPYHWIQEGAHKGCPYRWIEEGTHKGCPYR